MKQVTRDIDPGEARDLLERVPRACIAFSSSAGPVSRPVELVWKNDRYFIGIAEGEDQGPDGGDEVVLLVDEGVLFFDLRAIYVRGRIMAADAPAGGAAGRRWFELVSAKTVAWDYGRLREVEDEG
jgi:hypothetical protein